MKKDLTSCCIKCEKPLYKYETRTYLGGEKLKGCFNTEDSDKLLVGGTYLDICKNCKKEVEGDREACIALRKKFDRLFEEEKKVGIE
jgi:hypothetical protein